MRKCGTLIWITLATLMLATAGRGGEKIVIKLGSPKGMQSPINQACYYLSEKVLERTGGTVEIEVFPAGQLGFERDLVEGLAQGTIDMAWSSTALVGNFEEALALFSLPYVFRDYDHVHKTVASDIGRSILQSLLDNWDIRTLGFYDQGFRHVWNNQKPVYTLEDIQGMKLRGPESPIYIDTFKLLGVNVTPISWGETYTAIQTGVVAGLEQPFEEIVASRFYDICNYGSLTYHMYAGGLLMIREDLFQSLSEEQQKILLETCKETEEMNNNAVVELEREFIQVLRDNGMEINDINPAEMEKFAAAMAPLYAQYAAQLGGEDIIERIRAIR